MKRLLDFSKNKKTYAVVAVGIALGIADAFGYHVPSYVEWGLAFLGLGTMRSSLKNHSAETTKAVVSLIQEALKDVSEEEPVKDPRSNEVAVERSEDQLELPVETPNQPEKPLTEQEQTKQLNLRSIGKA